MIRVMIVDDQRILLEGLLHLFEKTGKIEVVKILQLSEVAEVAAQVLQPDIILMDICMEGRTSGIEVTRRIKKALPRQKIIIMTGFADVHFVEMAREAGADSFIYKESSAADFVDTMERTLKGEHLFPNVKDQPPSASITPALPKENWISSAWYAETNPTRKSLTPFISPEAP